MIGALAVASMLITQVVSGQPNSAEFQDRVGDTYEVSVRYETRTTRTDGSRSSSSSGDLLMERVVAVHGSDLELKFDLSPEVADADRARNWQFPAEVLRTAEGELRLLNASDLRTRLGEWMELADLTPDLCGRWFFSWTVFKIECEPESVLTTIADYDIRTTLSEGAEIRMPGTLGVSRLRREAVEEGQSALVAEFPIDAESVRAERAEAAVVVAEISGEAPISLETALEDQRAEQIVGTVIVHFEVDAWGRATRRIRVTALEITDPTGVIETTTATQTVERRMHSHAD